MPELSEVQENLDQAGGGGGGGGGGAPSWSEITDLIGAVIGGVGTIVAGNPDTGVVVAEDGSQWVLGPDGQVYPYGSPPAQQQPGFDLSLSNPAVVVGLVLVVVLVLRK